VLAVAADKVRLYDLDAPPGESGVLWKSELPSPAGEYSSVAFHPTEDVLAAADGAEVWAWDPVKGVRLGEPRPSGDGPTALVFTPDGHRLFVGCGDEARLLDPRTWEVVRVCRHAGKHVRGVAASPCGRWLATCGSDHTVRFWNPDAGAEERVFDRKIGPVTAVAFAPDGLTCAAGGANGRVVVWDVDA
jgi:hypothetical protein